MPADEGHAARQAPAGDNRPLVTFAIVTYNQEKYVRLAIEAAFAQTYSPLVIAISDDASSDATYEIVEDLCRTYRGPHRIRYSRNAHNLGLIEHINLVNRSAEGELIVIGAGDDISVAHRVERIVDAYLRSERRSHYFYSLVRAMTESGELQGAYQSPGADAAGSKLRAGLSNYPISIGAAQAWTKRLVERFGPLHRSLWAEDQVLGFRGVLLGPVTFIDEPLVHYRSGAGMSSTKKSFSLRRYVKNQAKVLAMYRQRAADALAAREHALAAVIYSKRLALMLLFPLSPVFSLLRRRRRTKRRGQEEFRGV